LFFEVSAVLRRNHQTTKHKAKHKAKHKLQSTKFKALRPKTNQNMTPKEIAAQYDAKVFDTPEAAKVAGFVCTDSMAPRNVWNKASAAQAIVSKLATERASGKAKEIGLVIEPWSVTGCYLPSEPEPAAA
jgi:hypothetical protein